MSRNFYRGYFYMHIVSYATWLCARLEARHAKVSGSNELSQPRWLAVSTRPLVGLRIRLPSFARAFPSLFAFHLHLSAREGIVRANRTSRTRRRGRGALCLSSARNLPRSLVKHIRVREGKRQRAAARNGAKTRCTIAYGRFPAHVGHIDSIYCTSIIFFVTRKKLYHPFRNA